MQKKRYRLSFKKVAPAWPGARLVAPLLIMLFIMLTGYVQAQTVSLTGKNLSLKQVFAAIKQQTGYVVFSKKELLNNAKPVTIDARNLSLIDFLQLALRDQQLDYTIQDRTIIISARPRPLNDNNMNYGQPAIYMRVQVVSSSKPLAGASVSVKKRNVSTITDEDGNCHIALLPGDELMVSFVGFETRRLLLDQTLLSTSNLVVGLTAAVVTLENINVVQTGYQTLSKERATGSFSKPDMKVFSQRSAAMDLVSRLEGQIPGMLITSTSTIDVNTRSPRRQSLIRGSSSVSLSTEPLYVVDGLIVADLNVLNVDDVEDITVLKDAAASAIWGAKAANGVIVVKTKSGKKNQKIAFAYSGFTEVKGRPDMHYQRYMNSRQFVTTATELFDPVNNPYDALTFDQVTPQEEILYAQNDGRLTAAQAKGKLDSLAGIDNTSQVRNLLFQNAVTTNHNISASGGGEKYSFYSSFGYNNATGSLPSDNARTYRFSLNQTYTPNSRFTLSVNTQLSSVTLNSKNNFNYQSSMLPYQLFRDAAGNNLSMPWITSYYSPEQRQLYQDMSGVDLQTFKPLDEINYAYSKTNALTANITADAGVKIWKGISFKGTYGYTTAPRTIKSYQDHQEYDQRNRSINFIPVDGSPAYIPLTGGTLTTLTANQVNWTVRNQLLYEYSGREGKDQLNLQVGQEANENVNTGITTTVLGWDEQLQTSPYIDFNTLRNGVFNTVTGSGFLGINPYVANETRYRFSSYFALASYRLNRKYSLDASWRVDHSNLFGSDVSAQNKPVYSIGGKWSLANEPFMNNIHWIDQLALRATYGVTGNSPPVGSATSFDILQAETFLPYPQTAGPAYTVSTAANRKLVWESSKTINLGVDFGFFNNRLLGSIEYYNKKTNNLLGSAPTDPFVGLSNTPRSPVTLTANIGDMSNNGINASITSVNIQSHNFNWSTTFNFAFNKNKLLSYTIPESYESQAFYRAIANYVVGYSLQPVFAYKYAGLDDKGDPQIKLADGKITKDPQAPTATDLVYMGSAIPKFNGGISNTFTYKQFSLTLNMIYSLGAVMRRDVNQFYSGRPGGSNITVDFFDRWKQSGDEKFTNMPSYVADPTYNYTERNTSFYTQADINVISASYLKLRDATLSYSFSEEMLKPLKLQGASIRFQLNNVMLWKNNKYGIDPEYYSLRSGFRTIRIGEHAIAIGASINF